MTAEELARYLDEYLDTASVSDYPTAWNGLQVDRSGPIQRVAFAVDAAQATVDAAVKRGADLLIVHHGLFWDGDPRVTGRRFRRIQALLSNNMGLYASHLPLDSHSVVGNNVVLAQAIGVAVEGSFAGYKGVDLGVHGVLDIDREGLVARLEAVLNGPVRLIGGGPEQIRRVGIVTGGGASYVEAARRTGLDALITGEGAHHNYFDAMEGGVNLYLGGHYATEVWGLKALAEHLRGHLGLDCFFVDHPTGL